jgi:hypothetical protein
MIVGVHDVPPPGAKHTQDIVWPNRNETRYARIKFRSHMDL